MPHTPATTQAGLSHHASKPPGSLRSAKQPKRPQSAIPKPPSTTSAATTQIQSSAQRVPKPSRNSFLAASPSAIPNRPQLAMRNAKKPSTITTSRDPTTPLSSGLLTPGSVHSRASSTNQATPAPSIATPRAPRKQDSRVGSVENHEKVSDSNSLYMEGHVGEHCIKGALVHRLACGHKVMTVKVEECASNCVRPLVKHLQAHANRATEEAFVCEACIEQHVQSHREAKRVLFELTFKATERRMIAFPDGWLDQQRSYWEKVWENDIVVEKDAFALLGRKSHHFGDHIVVQSSRKNKSPSTKVPFRPNRGSKAGRALNRGMSRSVKAESKNSNGQATEEQDSKRDSILE